MKFNSFLLFGGPGCGKGTQGKILGALPGFVHVACGDVFRSIDLKSEIGQVFLQYSSKGELVPDDFTVRLWKEHIDGLIRANRFKPEHDTLALDGIPRNVNQAKMIAEHINVRRVFHLTCPDRNKLVERLKRRALKENRLDDASEETIRHRLEIYEAESKPVLQFYGKDLISVIDADQSVVAVLDDILHVVMRLDRNK